MNYFTISDIASNSYTEKKSEFIGYIAPVKSNDEAVAFIDKIRSMHRKARHNVYAYILRKDNISRYSDDGEPQGTAGAPIFDVLEKKQLTDICLVISRYFGGILLGSSGLLRAYSHTASITCDSANIMDMRLCRRLIIETSYDFYGKINYNLSKFEIIIVNSYFSDTVKLEILLMSEKLEDFLNEITNITKGSAHITDCGEMYEDFSSVINYVK